jgi:hypothetical protein
LWAFRLPSVYGAAESLLSSLPESAKIYAVEHRFYPNSAACLRSIINSEDLAFALILPISVGFQEGKILYHCSSVLNSHGPLPPLLEAPNASESPILFKSYGQTHESEHQTRNRSLRACTEPPAKGTGIVGASVQSGRPKTLASGRPILPRLF